MNMKFLSISILILAVCIELSAQTFGTTEAGFIDGAKPQMDKPIRFSNYKNGAVLFVDFNNNAIRTITKEGEVITLFGGPDKKGFKDGFVEDALFAGMHGVAYDSKKDIIYVASATNNVIRKISEKEGNLFVETIAGNQAEKGFNDGTALSAQFNSLHQLLLGENGEIYILDIGNAKVRMLKDGMVSTLAGTDSIAPLKVEWKYPIDMAFDGNDIVICDAGNMNLYRLTLNSKVEKLELDTKLNMPHGIASDNNGTLYIADMGGNKILKIEGDKKVTVIEDKNLNKPAAVLVDKGLLWIADLYNHQIKIINLD
jgi:DNA-binding beta-propeller fold protein YncE